MESPHSTSYDYGDIFDCKEMPAIGHFIVIIGTDKDDNILYFRVLSRVYKVFDTFCEYLNDCKENGKKINCKLFERAFSKEKDNETVNVQCDPRSAYFLDKKDYPMLTSHSVLMINKDAEKINRSILDSWKNEGKITRKDRLVGSDFFTLKTMLEWSDNISPASRKSINKAFDSVQGSVRQQEKVIRKRNREKSNSN